AVRDEEDVLALLANLGELSHDALEIAEDLVDPAPPDQLTHDARGTPGEAGLDHEVLVVFEHARAAPPVPERVQLLLDELGPLAEHQVVDALRGRQHA